MNFYSITSHVHLLLLMLLAFLGLQRDTFVSGVFRDHVDVQNHQSSSLTKEPVPEHQKSVVTCKLGQPHPTYPECRCGEYAVRVPEIEVSAENRGDYHVRTKTTYRGLLKQIYYYCLFCSLCEDGVRTKTNCTQREDTQCMTGVCKDPTHIYDKGRRGCFPDPARMTTTKSPTTGRDLNFNALNENAHSSASHLTDNDSFSNGTGGHSMSSSLPGIREYYIIVLGCFIAVGMVIILIVNIFVCHYFCQKKKKEDDQEQESMISRTTSTPSLVTV